MNVLGIAFDPKLNWQTQVENKSKPIITGHKLICKHFPSDKLLQLITSNFYSLIYYNREM